MKNIISIIIISVLVGTVLTFVFGYWQARWQLVQQRKEMVEMSKEGILGEIDARGGFPWKFISYGLAGGFNVVNFILDSILLAVVVFVILLLI